MFFGEEADALYRDLLASQCRTRGVAVFAYCLMPNRVHLILVPEALGRALGRAAPERALFGVLRPYRE